MRSIAMVAVVVGLMLAACGDAGGQAGAHPPSSVEPPDGVDASEPVEPVAGEERTVTGTFGGDAQLEGGCAWIASGDTKWNVQYPQGYTLTFDPLRLTGPDGFVAEDGQTLTVTGRERSDVMTTCQIGPVFEATEVVFGA
ncbi:MAG: hypothetical protein ICV72_14065 [Aldersonia sp.]|nr:hypothetical protein [Aldersonia sp.]